MANCYVHCGIRKPVVDAPQITEEMVELDAGIIAELMEQVHQLLYDYPMDILNLLNHPGGNVVTFLTTEDEIVANICPSKEEIGQVVIAEEDDCSKEKPIMLHEAKDSLEVLDLFIIQKAGDQSDHLAMVRKLWDAVAKLGVERQVQTTPRKLFFSQVASSF